MSDQIDFTTVLFALVAVFVVWKMRTILGTRHESSADLDSQAQGNASLANSRSAERLAEDGSEGNLRWMPFATFGTDMWEKLDQISKIDPAFDPREFVEGAKAAYELILKAFSAGDLLTLKPLLGRDVFDSFEAVISDRQSKGVQLQTTLVSLDRSEMKEIKIEGKTAQIIVRFASKVISFTKDENGSVLDGAADKVAEVVDVWTFQRDLDSSDPNWRLVSTEEPH